MNKRFLFLTLLTYALFLAAALAQNGAMAVMAIPFLVYLMIGALRSPGEVRLSAQRSLSKFSAAPGEAVEVRITVENQGKELVNLRLADGWLPAMQLEEGEHVRRLALPAGARTELAYAFNASRGCYRWEGVQALASDPFGLLEVSVEAPASGEVLVFPASQRLRHIALRPRHTLHSAGPIPARRGGSGTDFWGVRQYRPGDPLRWLAWRRTARQPHLLFTKEFEQEEIADIALILDARSITVHTNGDLSLFEHAVSACASLTELFIREGNRVGLMIYGDRLPYLSPGYGKLQHTRILAELARATPGASFTLDSLKNLPVRLFPSRAVLFFISPLGENDAQVLARLRGQGYQIVLVSPDPVRFAARSIQGNSTARLAYRAARLERIALLKQIVRMGVPVVDWQVERPLTNALQAIFQQAGNPTRPI